jgi:hypothetical protein
MLRYRAPWIFGVILALTNISFGSALWMRNNREPSSLKTFKDLNRMILLRKIP